MRHHRAMTSAGSRGRRLARGSSADIAEWLPAGLSPVDAARAGIVIKVRRGDGARRRALAEAAALSAVDHPHIIGLRGLDDDGDSLGLLLPRLSIITARRWLDVRSPLPAGEAVTLLVPLLRALAHIERRGIGRTVDLADGVDLDDVLFDDRGAPIITSLRAAATDDAARSRRWPGGAAGAGLRLVKEVAGHLHADADHGELDALLAPGGASIDELIETVFALAAPEPLTRADVEGDPPDASTDHDAAAPAAGWQGVLALTPLAAFGRRMLGAAREIRPRVWVTCAIVGISAVAGVIAATAGEQEPSPTATSPAAASRPRAAALASGSALPLSGSTLPPSGSTGSARAEAAAPTAATGAPPTSPVVESSSLTGAPEAAFPVLLRLRAACLRALDTECIAGVDEADSPAIDGDQASIAQPRLLKSLPVDLSPGTVVNRLGGAVLFAARDDAHDRPASVLLTRSEAGWRLRSIVVDAPGGG
jgi:hypothetical protein